jgi:hypothetical protein
MKDKVVKVVKDIKEKRQQKNPDKYKNIEMTAMKKMDMQVIVNEVIVLYYHPLNNYKSMLQIFIFHFVKSFAKCNLK